MEAEGTELSLSILKARIRDELWGMMKAKGLSPAPYGCIPSFLGQSKAAERLRRLAVYKRALTVMVPPDQAQLQVRINAVLDGKRLILATPGLKDGFYLIEKGQVGIKDLARAVRSSGVHRFGKGLMTSCSEIGDVDLLVTGAVAVGLKGERIGKGSGYFDLEYMILRQIGSVTKKTPVIALVDDPQVREGIPMEDKDVAVDIIVTPTRIIMIETPPQRPSGLMWDLLDERTVRRVRPLRELRRSDGHVE